MPSDCLTEDQLQQLVRSPNSVSEDAEAHLSECLSCQHALELITGEIRPDGACPTILGRTASHVTWAADHSSQEGLSHVDELPAMIGPFTIIGLLGQGGMGVVYRAEDTKLKRTVAIKVLHSHIAADPALQARLLTEAQAVARVEHENVVTIHAVEEGAGSPYLVMQHVRGGSLSSRVEKGPLEVDDVVRIGTELAAGLAAAHRQGVVHRDLKPANILLDAESKRVLISDFGLARVLDQPGQTRSGVVAGTPEFMAPEQALGLPVGPAADLFALGTVLYYALTGISPFRSDNAIVCLRLVCEHEPVAIDALRGDVPEWLAATIAKLMAKTPEDRFASADEVLTSLQQQRSTGHAVSPSDLDVAGTTPRKQLFFAAVLLCLLTAAAIMWRNQVTVSPPSTTSAKQSAKESPAPGPEAQTYPPGFVAAGRHFSSLGEAVEATPSGGEIQVFGTRALECDPVAIVDKPLTIRAGIGQQPRCVSVTGVSDRPWITTNENLVVEGLTIEWSVASPDEASAGSSGGAAIIAKGDQLLVTNCRFDVGTGTAGLEFSSRRAQIDRCEFLGPGGFGIRWTSDSLSDLSLSHCHFGTFSAIIAHLYRAGFEPAVGTLTISHSQLSGGRGIQFLGNRGPKRRIVIEAEENLFFLQYLFLLEGQLAAPRMRGLPEQQLRMLLHWDHDRRNVYSPSITFLAFQGPQRVRAMPMAETLPDWLEFWQLPESGSLSLAATEEMPNGVGPDRSILGPGAPFDAWRKHSAATTAAVER